MDKLTLAIESALINCAIRLMKFLFNGLIKGSFWLCLIACMLSLVMYIAGQRKAGKYVSITFILYVLLQALKGALNL
ncbi:MAG: hypothetical protein ACRC7S_14730 [Cetobacterium sp.]